MHSELSPKQISTLCGVTTRTARRWLSGKTNPPAAAKRLIQATERRRMMPESWPSAYQFQDNGHLDTGHTTALGWQQIDWYTYSVHCWYQLLELLPEIEARLDALLKVAPLADVIDLERYRAQLIALKERPFVLPANFIEYYDLPDKTTHRKTGC